MNGVGRSGPLGRGDRPSRAVGGRATELHHWIALSQVPAHRAPRRSVEEVIVEPGMSDWAEPQPRVHRGVNAREGPYEEVVVFLLPAPHADPQPGPPEPG